MKKTHAMRSFCSSAVAILATAAMLAIFSAGTAFAQRTDRMVRGKIGDNSGRPLSGAIVYLKDTRTLDVKSYITEKDGLYRFDQLSNNDDYKLWAERNEKKSAVRTISSFDNRKSFLINLRIDTGK